MRTCKIGKYTKQTLQRPKIHTHTRTHEKENAIRAKSKIDGESHHDVLVFTLEIHCDSKRVAHEALVQLVKPILVPSNRVRTRF